MRKTLSVLAAVALLGAGTPAIAGDYGGHRRHGHGIQYGHGYVQKHGHRPRHGYYRPAPRYKHARRHRRHDHDGAVFGALIGGVVVGHLLTRPAYSAPVYYAPPPQPVLRNCLPTTGTGYADGRPAEFGGTMCYDRYGRGYIVPGSEYFIGYLR